MLFLARMGRVTSTLVLNRWHGFFGRQQWFPFWKQVV